MEWWTIDRISSQRFDWPPTRISRSSLVVIVRSTELGISSVEQMQSQDLGLRHGGVLVDLHIAGISEVIASTTPMPLLRADVLDSAAFTTRLFGAERRSLRVTACTLRQARVCTATMESCVLQGRSKRGDAVVSLDLNVARLHEQFGVICVVRAGLGRRTGSHIFGPRLCTSINHTTHLAAIQEPTDVLWTFD